VSKVSNGRAGHGPERAATRRAVRLVPLGLAIATAAVVASSAGASTNAVGQARSITAAAEKGYVTSQTPSSPLFAVKKFPGPKTAPTNAQVPHNKNITFIAAGVPLQYAATLQQRLTAPLGWHINYVQTPGTPVAFANGFQQAIAQHPGAIELAGLPDATVVPQINAARAAKIKTVATAGPQLVHPGFDAYLSVRFDAIDRVAANLAISDSNGSANVLFAIPSGYTEVDQNAPAFSKALAACSKCKNTTKQYSIPDFLNPVTLQSNITAALNANPKINYVVDAFDQAPSQPVVNAIRKTGRKIKLILLNGSLTGLSMVANGSAIADVSVASNWIEYAEADDLRRVLAGKPPLPFNGWIGGTHVFTKANLPATITDASVARALDAVGPYKAAYQKLWTKGHL